MAVYQPDHPHTRHEPTAEELEAIRLVERMLRLIGARTGDDSYGELADQLALRMYGPVVISK